MRPAEALLEAAGLPPEAVSANKRRLRIDVRDDALGRMGTIRTLIELLLGRHAGSVVCRRWRDASRGLTLTKDEEEFLCRAVASDHTNPHLLANLGYYDVTTLDLSWRDAALYEGPYRLRQHVVFDDAAVRALAERCRNITTVVLRGCTGLSHAAVAALVGSCPKLTDVDLSYLPNFSAHQLSTAVATRLQ